MKLRLPIATAFFFVLTFCAKAQNEVHFSQFDYAPIQLNPALAGNFGGTYRIGGIYRDQWFTVANSPFRTLDFFVDVNIIRGLRKQDWVSVGLGYSVLDQGGALGLKNNFFNMGAAYHLANKKRTSIISLGVQRSSVSSNINMILAEDDRPAGLSTDASQFNSGGSTGGAGGQGEDGIMSSFSDWEFGVVFNKRAATSDFKVGISATRLFNPRFNLGNSNSEIDPLLTAFAEYKMPVGKTMYLKPSLIYQTQGPASELALQARMGKTMSEDLCINGGLGYRVGDAAQVLIGADYKQYRIGASYDINLSGLIAGSSSVGAFELALIYTGVINKKPKLKPVLICPRL